MQKHGKKKEKCVQKHGKMKSMLVQAWQK